MWWKIFAKFNAAYQELGTAERGDLDGCEARGVGGGGHGLDAAEEDLHVLLARGLALVEEGAGARHAAPPVPELPLRPVALELVWIQRGWGVSWGHVGVMHIIRERSLGDIIQVFYAPPADNKHMEHLDNVDIVLYS